MSEFNVAFSPLLPWWMIAALGVAALLVLLIGAMRGQDGAWLRGIAAALALAALTDPALLREKRAPQKTIVAVVADRSESQTFGARTAQTDEAMKALEPAFARFGDIEMRVVTAAKEAGGDNGTRLFSALAEALKDTPPERIGGAILVTDGVVHDIPGQVAALGFSAPVHALITGCVNERDRRIELVEAPRFGIVGKDQIVRARVIDSGGDNARAPISVRRDGETLPTYSPVPGDIVNIPVRIAHGGPNIVELEIPPVPGELTLVDNKAVV